jgi:hypothetical protein
MSLQDALTQKCTFSRSQLVAYISLHFSDACCRYNWAENMRAWRLDMHLPYPGAAGALVHSGAPPDVPAARIRRDCFEPLASQALSIRWLHARPMPDAPCPDVSRPR